MSDARFEEGAAAPIRLVARDAEDLRIVSSLVQDSVLPTTDLRWERSRRRFALLLNRFRWEDRVAAERAGRPPERVRTLMVVHDVLTVASQGIDRADADMVLSLLAVAFEAGQDGEGQVVLTFAGDGALRLGVECLDVMLRDVTRPHLAAAGRVPSHPD